MPQLTDDQVADAVAFLAQARARGGPLPAFPEACRPATIGDAYRIAQATRSPADTRPDGWKAGASSAAQLRDAGLATPPVAPLFPGVLCESPADLDGATYHLCIMEAEVAFRLGDGAALAAGSLHDGRGPRRRRRRPPRHRGRQLPLRRRPRRGAAQHRRGRVRRRQPGGRPLHRRLGGARPEDARRGTAHRRRVRRAGAGGRRPLRPAGRPAGDGQRPLGPRLRAGGGPDRHDGRRRRADPRPPRSDGRGPLGRRRRGRRAAVGRRLSRSAAASSGWAVPAADRGGCPAWCTRPRPRTRRRGNRRRPRAAR